MNTLIETYIGRCDLCQRTMRLQYQDRDTGWKLCIDCAKHVHSLEGYLKHLGFGPCVVKNNRGPKFT